MLNQFSSIHTKFSFRIILSLFKIDFNGAVSDPNKTRDCGTEKYLTNFVSDRAKLEDTPLAIDNSLVQNTSCAPQVDTDATIAVTKESDIDSLPILNTKSVIDKYADINSATSNNGTLRRCRKFTPKFKSFC